MTSSGPLRVSGWAVIAALAGVVAYAEAEPAADRRARPAAPRVAVSIGRPLPERLPDFAETVSPARSELSAEGGAPARADDVLHLPKLTVRPSSPGPSTDFSWLSPKGRLERAMKKAPGLKWGNLFGTNNAVALLIQVEEREAAARADLSAQIERVNLGDDEDAQKTRRLLEAAAQRPNTDWATGGGGK